MFRVNDARYGNAGGENLERFPLLNPFSLMAISK